MPDTKSRPKGQDTQVEFNPRWKGYLYIWISSLINFATISGIDIDDYPQFDGIYQVSMVFGVSTFALTCFIIILDRFGHCCCSDKDQSDRFNYTKSMDGKIEGYTLLGLTIWWIVGVGLITRVAGIAYVAMNIYFSSWLTLFACIYTLDKWSAAKDILSIRELTGVSATLKSWYVLFLSSLVAMGTSCDLMGRLSHRFRGSAAAGVVLSLISTVVALFVILVHYRIVDFEVLQVGGWVELSFSFFMILLWLSGVAILTSEGGIAATIGGSGCTSSADARYDIDWENECYVVWAPYTGDVEDNTVQLTLVPDGGPGINATEAPAASPWAPTENTTNTTSSPTIYYPSLFANETEEGVPSPSATSANETGVGTPLPSANETEVGTPVPSANETEVGASLPSTNETEAGTPLPSANKTESGTLDYGNATLYPPEGLFESIAPSSLIVPDAGEVNQTEAPSSILDIDLVEEANIAATIQPTNSSTFNAATIQPTNSSTLNAATIQPSNSSTFNGTGETSSSQRMLQEMDSLFNATTTTNLTNATSPPTPKPTEGPTSSSASSMLPSSLPSTAPSMLPSNWNLPNAERGACSEILEQMIPGSNLYLSCWICFFAAFNITLRWKAAQALQFAQAQNRKADERAGRAQRDDLDGSASKNVDDADDNERDPDGSDQVEDDVR